MYTYVCIHTYIHIHIDTYTYIHTNISIYICTIKCEFCIILSLFTLVYTPGRSYPHDITEAYSVLRCKIVPFYCATILKHSLTITSPSSKQAQTLSTTPPAPSSFLSLPSFLSFTLPFSSLSTLSIQYDTSVTDTSQKKNAHYMDTVSFQQRGTRRRDAR